MDELTEKRREQRLRYRGAVRLTEQSDKRLLPGQIIDISSCGAAFFCHADQSCPQQGQQITASFTVPRFGSGSSLKMTDFTRTGSVCRVEEVNDLLRRIAIQFAEPLSFKPGEQGISESDAQKRLAAVPKSVLFR